MAGGCKMPEIPIVISAEPSIAADFLIFLRQISAADIEEEDPDWKAKVSSQSRLLGPVLVQNRSASGTTLPRSLKIDVGQDREGMGLYSVPSEVLNTISTSLGLACAAGGYKILIDLIKAWVEERKGRVIKIKYGDAELEIRGGVKKADAEKVINLFRERFGDRRIMLP